MSLNNDIGMNFLLHPEKRSVVYIIFVLYCPRDSIHVFDYRQCVSPQIRTCLSWRSAGIHTLSTSMYNIEVEEKEQNPPKIPPSKNMQNDKLLHLQSSVIPYIFLFV